MTQCGRDECAAARLSPTEVVYLGAWHSVFFHASVACSYTTPRQRIVGALQLVGACGFDMAAQYAAQLHLSHEANSGIDKEGEKEAETEVRDALQSVAAAWQQGGADCDVGDAAERDETHALSPWQHSRSWPQWFLLSTALCVLSQRSSPSIEDVMKYLLRTIETTVTTANNSNDNNREDNYIPSSSAVVLSSAPSSVGPAAPSSRDASARADWDWWVSMSHPLLTTSSGEGSASTRVSNDVSLHGDTVFELHLPSQSQSSPSASSSSTRRSALRRRWVDSVRRTFYTARLYAALVLAGNVQSPISAVATLLIAYMMQDDRAVRQLLVPLSTRVDSAADAADTIHHNAGGAGAQDEQAARLLRRARMRGVVAGVMEYGMHCARQHTSRVTRALDEMAASAARVGTSRAPHSTSRVAGGNDATITGHSRNATHGWVSAAGSGSASRRASSIAARLESLGEAYSCTQVISQASYTTALLLARVVELLHRHDKSSSHPTATSTAAGGSDSRGGGAPHAVALATTVATDVIHAVHELMYTIVLGRGSAHMASRPAQPTSSHSQSNIINNSDYNGEYFSSDDNSANIDDEEGDDERGNRRRMRVRGVVGATASSAQTRAARAVEGAVRWGGVVVTRRGLCLSEVDNITHHFFPLLLQQLGYTWPWSVLLRQSRMLDKEQQPHQSYLPTTLSHSMHSSHRDHSAVMWSSRLLTDTLLAALPRHTYTTRLRHALPASYDRVVRDLVVFGQSDNSVRNDSNDNGAATGEDGVTRPAERVFVTPAYYDNDAMSAVLNYFASAAVTGWTTEELERVLTSAVAMLPLTAQLRALAPAAEDSDEDSTGVFVRDNENNDDDDDDELSETAMSRKRHRDDADGATHTRGSACVLTRERVAALERRYCAELLLTALVMHTQLQTASHIQQAYRAVAPLLAKLLFHVGQSSVGRGVYWVEEEACAAAQVRYTSARGAPPARFVREATLLMGRVGYQLYPLEWLPDYVEIYTQWHAHRSSRSNSNNNDSSSSSSHTDGRAVWAKRAVVPASSSSSASPLPYSVFAAVAHQLGLYLRTHAHGGSADASQCHPAGTRSPIVTPPAHVLRYTQLCHNDHDDNADEDNEDDVQAGEAHQSRSSHSSGTTEGGMGELSCAWLRRERYLRDLMLGQFLTARDSACVCEGPLAVASTRRVGMVCQGKGADSTTTAEMQKAWRLLLSHSLHDNCSTRGIDSNLGDCAVMGGKSDNNTDSEGAGAAAAAGAATVVAMKELSERLMSYGAASFIDVLQAKDIVLTMAQCLLPATTQPGARGRRRAGTTNSAHLRRGPDLLLYAQSWCEAMFGEARQARWYNSCTVDAVPLCRELLRAVPVRLWSKMCARRQAETMLRQAVARQSAAADRTAAAKTEHKTAQVAHGEAGEAEVDALLVHEWRVWKYWVTRFGWAREKSCAVEEERAAMLTATQLLWCSPHFAEELLLD